MTVISPLDDEFLSSNKEIIIILTASADDTDSTSEAVLIINWYAKEVLEFSKEYYKGVYPDDGSSTVTLEEPIGFTNVANPEDVVVELLSK